MHSIGLLPALASGVGAVSGLGANVSARGLAVLLLPIVCACVFAWRRGASRTTTGLLVCGFAISAAALAIDARERALHPPLRTLLDAAYGGFVIETLGPEGLHDPADLRLRLIIDAAPVGDVVVLRGSALAIRLGGVWHPLWGEGVRITVAGTVAAEQAIDWRAGRTIVAPVSFRRPARYLNAGVADAERDLALSGTALLGSVKSGLLVEVLAAGSRVQEAAGRARLHVRRSMARWVAPHGPVAAGIVSAVLIGDRTGLPPEIRDRLQAAGTYHVIAISGGNIAILAGFVFLALMPLGVQGRPAAVVVLLVLIGYFQLVAAEPSVWRATLMAAAYLIARLGDQRTPAWHAIAMAAACMVWLHPLDIRNPGFILSFGATAALIGGASRASAVLSRGLGRHARRTCVRWWVTLAAASMAVETVVMPIAAQGFSQITAAGLVLNLLAVPLMAVVQIAGIVTALCAGVEPVGWAAGWVAWASAVAIVESARLVEALPWLARRVPPPGMAVIAVYYAGLALVLLWPRARRVGAAAMVLATIIIVCGLTAIDRRGRASPAAVRLTVFDVGQAESLLLEVPGAKPIVIDAAGAPFGTGSFDIGRRVLSPALWAIGVRRLDSVLVTHADPDHVGGARTLVEDFNARRLVTGVPVPAHAPTNALMDSARRAGASLETWTAGEMRTWGKARIRVLHPGEPDWERQQVRNDDSVVLEVVYGDVALLLTGDIGADVERAILPHLTPARLRVLKVAHHGSRSSTSETLIAHWQPQVAIISCGRGNTFGHPAPEVLERLAEIGAEVFRTDTDGQITVETDGRRLRVETFLGNAR